MSRWRVYVHWRLALGISSLILVAGLSFLAVELITEGSTTEAVVQPTPPSLTTTPPAGATPDMNSPNWYVPYLNADKVKPPLNGVLAGLEIMPFDDSVPIEQQAGACPPGTTTLREVVSNDLNSSPLGIRLGSFASSLTATDQAQGLQCDGNVRTVSQDFSVAAGTSGATAAGGQVHIYRAAVGKRYWLPQAQDRWGEGTVGAKKAALLRPVIGMVGTSAVIVNDDPGFTAIIGEGVSLDLLQKVAAEVER